MSTAPQYAAEGAKRRERGPCAVRASSFFSIVMLIGCQSLPPQPAESDATLSAELASAYESIVVPFTKQYCLACHDAEEMKGDIDLESFESPGAALAETELWDRVRAMIQSGEMPPKKRPQPKPDEVALVVEFLLEHGKSQRVAMTPDPGRVTVRRLNRAEYNNTVRDLLGVEFRPADDFPADDSGYGFDTIGSVLSVSPLLLEKYLAAAERIARDVVMRESCDNDASTRHFVLTCEHPDKPHTKACARRVLEPLARRAYRRPPTAEEMKKLTGFVGLAAESGDGFEQGVEIALQALLVSPQFIYRIEHNEPARFGKRDRRLEDYELASRLSYFLWSSMPDDELLDTAHDGALRNPRVLREQLQRMLRDPKSAALADHFAGQWLEFRNMAVADPDPKLFPSFDNALRSAMTQETSLFFGAIVRDDRSILEFIDANYTYLNERLARHYGIEGVTGDSFRRVAVNPGQRGGVLTHASVLTVTSYPTRTSPVLRGVWVLQNILAAPPPAPPPDVPALEAANIDPNAPMRERLEAHRKNESCASCHARIDPLGFGLENFDAIGAWRTTEGDRPIDNSGTLPDGRSFSGVEELKKMLMERKDDFARCLAEKMLTYGLGRGLEPYDAPVVDKIVANVARNEYRFSALAYEIVSSLPFQKRRGEDEIGGDDSAEAKTGS
ncbi:MAG: DUF1592 domain-containing protein [Candidatus Hydrogenedentes bacterium]|nr:DUF1592 domain-containing protein [Candidatus Hydrogenedentota bacterium]